MISFFRKIRQNLIMENKTGKYFKYAIGEILLVMIGILLALQVSNWNQNRINSQKESLLLKELHEEFSNNQTQPSGRTDVRGGLNFHNDHLLQTTRMCNRQYRIHAQIAVEKTRRQYQ